MAIQPSNNTANNTNDNEPFSLPKLFAKIFNFLSDLCQESADKESEKGDDKNKPAYLAARFFQYLFSAVGFGIEHAISWILNPKSILNDFQQVVVFFVDLGQKLANWWDELIGKKPAPTPNIETSIKADVIDNHQEKEQKHSSTAALLATSLKDYRNPAPEIMTSADNPTPISSIRDNDNHIIAEASATQIAPHKMTR